jgi:hypothetical protein
VATRNGKTVVALHQDHATAARTQAVWRSVGLDSNIFDLRIPAAAPPAPVVSSMLTMSERGAAAPAMTEARRRQLLNYSPMGRGIVWDEDQKRRRESR